MRVLGVKIDNLSLSGALAAIGGFLSDGRQHYIVLPYADFLVRAAQDDELCGVLNKADLCLSDGVGPVWASWIVGDEKLRGRITGVDLIWAVSARFGEKRGIFLFGGREGAAQEAARKMTRELPAIKISGALNGYVDDWEAIKTINDSGAEILLAALGSPKQEKWLAANLAKIPLIKVAVGVGGALDFISGRVRRAPRVIRKIGLEWLWRLFFQPSRRQWQKTRRTLIIFPFLVLRDFWAKLKNNCLLSRQNKRR